MKPLLIRSANLIEASGPKKSDVLIENEKISAITESGHDSKLKAQGSEIIDADNLLLLPLLIDCHVHFREPGLEHKATMATEAAAALQGGVGTVCEMPNTMPPTVTIAALADKVRRASDIAGCQIRFFFGVTEAAHLRTLKDLWTGTSYELKRLKNHCAGVKLFLDHSTGDQKVESGIVEEIFQVCAELKIPLVAHCEDSEINTKYEARNMKGDVALHSERRPPESEAKAIEYSIGLVRKYKTQFHVAHLSTKQGIEMVRAAKKEKLPVTCEVAPHHLFLTTDDYKTLGTLGKMNPPLRSSEHQKALWEGIADGTVDCIATDHAPHTLEEKKTANPLDAPSGVPGVATMLPLLLSVANGKWPGENTKYEGRNTKLSYADIVRLCFANPNRIFSLRQEGIVKGAPPRMILIDPNEEWILEGKNLGGKCGWTPFEGWKVKGKIVRTIQ